jgi:geranylgeranyl pyrophosphate synthase
MDNSALRRGKPTCHKHFDEATAVLAGDALLTYAFELLATHYARTPELAIQLIHELAQASGSQKLIGGQMEDILAEASDPKEVSLTYIHTNKTAALLQSSLSMGILLADAPAHALSEARTLGLHLGIAFQIVDDILDLTSTTEVLGKTTGLDLERKKMTYPALYGMDASKAEAEKHTQAALDACERLGGENDFLKLLVTKLLNRAH